ncbi:MAG: 6-phosphofructokinase [Defluviitaleaceae bacterium]|nr:6-phosphofructokinase [Defluviitaleaceae bacterium]
MAANGKQRIAVLTSGGDAPGMNAVIRAVVRTGVNNGYGVFGIKRGYDGLLSADIEEINSREVKDIIHRGGTILRTARCQGMMTEDGQRKAAEIAKVFGIGTLIVIGGDGTFKGGLALSKFGVNVIAIPATIDLDMACTEYTIGFDTAVNTGMDSINKLRDTSSSHERCSVVEVMGRDAGYLALWCGMAGGAEEVLIPESPETNTEAVIEQIIRNRSKGKKHNLVVVAEGFGGSIALSKEIERVLGIEARTTILGHLQRGGSPTALDRMHASFMGCIAVKAAIAGEKNKAVVFKGGKHVLIDLAEAIDCKKTYDPAMYETIKTLAV